MKIVIDSIFNRKVDAIVNPVNCNGIMGGGLALQFKERYPEMYEDYRKVCFSGHLYIGSLHYFRVKAENRWIINFPTKHHFRFPSQLNFIQRGLDCLISNMACNIPFTYSIHSIAVPALGCGLGGLKLEDVQPLIVKYLVPAFEYVELVLYP